MGHASDVIPHLSAKTSQSVEGENDTEIALQCYPCSTFLPRIPSPHLNNSGRSVVNRCLEGLYRGLQWAFRPKKISGLPHTKNHALSGRFLGQCPEIALAAPDRPSDNRPTALRRPIHTQRRSPQRAGRDRPYRSLDLATMVTSERIRPPTTAINSYRCAFCLALEPDPGEIVTNRGPSLARRQLM